MNAQVVDILKLSVAEKIQIVENIWNRIFQNPEQLSVSEAEKLELDKRLESYKKNPNEGIELETLRKNLTEKKIY